MSFSSTSPLWLIIDTRTAQKHIDSGIARTVVGITKALAQTLTTAAYENINILLVGKREPATWMIDLVNEYPERVKYWSGGPGSLTQKWERPVFAWSTFVLERISKITNGNFIWIAPANFDRPLLFPGLKGKKYRDRIAQIIHDTIPFYHKKSMGFFFRMQFKMLVKRTLSNYPKVLTVSKHSREQLLQLSPERKFPLGIIPFGVEEQFGHGPRLQNKEEARRLFLQRLFPHSSSMEEAEFKSLLKSKWILGVGREQKYKCWKLAEDVAQLCNKEIPIGTWLVRVGAENNEISFAQRVISISHLDDDLLAKIYLLADLLLHPSAAEGFGFPPLEAALSGLPVIYRPGTAVEDHFPAGSLPLSYWNALESQNENDWASAAVSVLNGTGEIKDFLAQLDKSPSTREYVLKRVNRTFDWSTSAKGLVDFLLAPNTQDASV